MNLRKNSASLMLMAMVRSVGKNGMQIKLVIMVSITAMTMFGIARFATSTSALQQRWMRTQKKLAI